MIGKRDLYMAKRLARIVAEAGEDNLDGLRPALERLLEGRSPSDRKAILKAFHSAAAREIQNNTLTVESAQALEAHVLDSMVESFNKNRTRALNVQLKTTPELISGVRVRLGDTVYETSVARQLQTLATNISQLLMYPRP